MKPNPKKVEEIKNTKSSDNVNALRRFLGLVNSQSVELQMVWKSIIFNFCLNLGHMIKVSAQTFPTGILNFQLKKVWGQYEAFRFI